MIWKRYKVVLIIWLALEYFVHTLWMLSLFHMLIDEIISSDALLLKPRNPVLLNNQLFKVSRIFNYSSIDQSLNITRACFYATTKS